MEKERIKIESPITISGVTVIPVTKSSLNYRSGKNGISIIGYKKPVSIVLLSDSMKKAFRIDGEEVSLEELTAEVPKLKEMLEKV